MNEAGLAAMQMAEILDSITTVIGILTVAVVIALFVWRN